MRDETKDAINAAIAKAGGKTELMRKLNAAGHTINSHNVIGQWQENGVPAKYCPDIEALTGIKCDALCPDVHWHLLRRKAAKA